MRNIADKLALLIQTKSDIRNALQNKGIDITDSDSFRTYANKISNISQFKQESAVRFFDYNGDVLYRFSFNEISELTELPSLPIHNGLTCQGWNWTLDDIKQIVSEYGKCDVGAIYVTDDGKTRLYIKILGRGRMSVPLRFQQSVSNGVTIDWGDGTSETVSETGKVTPRHTYSDVGEYVITLDVAEGCTVQLGNGSESVSIIGFSGLDIAYSEMLTKIEIGRGVTGILEYCFYGCASLSTVNIPSGITSIPSRAFEYCKLLKHLNLPSGVTSLGTNCVQGCSEIQYISLPTSINTLGAYVFQNCNVLKSVIIPNVVNIPNYVFGSCDLLSTVILGKTLEKIGDYAFECTYSLQNLDIYNNVTSIGQYAFRLSGIRNLIIPEGVTTLSTYTFSESKLVNVSLPNTLTTIKSYAFNKCNSLKEVIIPDSVSTIETYVFNECESLSKVKLPSGLTTIPNYTFYKCNSLTELVIPETVQTIGNSAFYSTRLKNINIPDSVTSIGNAAFSYCNYLPEITVPVLKIINAETFNYSNGAGFIDLTKFGSVPRYGSNSFANLASDCKVLVPNHLMDDWKKTSGWSGISSKITNGFTVSDIASYSISANNVVYGNTSYTSGDFSCNVSGINYFGEAELKNYSMAIRDLYVGMNKTSESISKEVVFEYAGENFPVTVTQGPYIENAIICTYNVTSTTSATTLLYSSFSNYSTYFSSMIIDGEEVTIAKTYKFSTTGEHSVLFKIAEGVEITNLYRMFYGCTALKTIDLSEFDMSLVTSTSTSSGTAEMFYGCSSLKTIILPESVKYLGRYMFRGCLNVESLTIKAITAPTVYSYYTWGYSSDYIGYNYRSYGSNNLYIPQGATDYDTGTWTSYLFSTNYCGFKKSSPYLKQECTNLTIMADDVEGRQTTTTINWTATVTCIDKTTDEIIELTFTGTEESESFPQNLSKTETVEREVSFSYMGITATDTITQGVWIDPGYTVDLNNQWVLSSSISNPDPSKYDGVYESNSNYHVSNGIAKMYIDIIGYEEFKFYIRSNGESSYDYVRVGNLDQEPSASTYVNTKSKQNSGTAISNYTLVTFSNIDCGSHRIIIDYIKDSSGNSGTDRGYVIIPIEQ